jgi:uncharacterized membrane protein
LLQGQAIKGVWVSCVVLLLLTSCSKEQGFHEARRTGEYVVVDVSELPPETPQYLTYQVKGKKVNFFVIKIGGRVLSYLDACASCYPNKKGYRFDKGHFTCRECNVRYSVPDMEKGMGRCFPIRVEGFLRDGKYVIPAAGLETVADKF